MNRRSSVPPVPIPEGALRGTRRSNARHEATERVELRGLDASEAGGWTLNLSSGGARIIVEERLTLGALYRARFGESQVDREVRVAWVQDERDGQIVGLQYLDVDGTIPPPPHPEDD